MAVTRIGGLQQLQPWVRDQAEVAIALFRLLTGGRVQGDQVIGGVTPVITSGYRTTAQQTALYNARASNPYPVNKPGDSAHQFGLGFDSSFNAADKARYMPLWVACRRELGFRVPDNDPVHAEVPNWRSLVKAAGVMAR